MARAARPGTTRPSAARRAGALAASALSLALSAAPAFAQSAPESAVKAAFITKFGPFVQWVRAEPKSSYVVCTLGHDAVASDLARLRAAGTPAVEVRALSAATATSGCDILYVAGDGRQSVAQALAAVEGRPVLTVTDARRTGVRGIIHFVVQGDRVRFLIDTGKAERNGLAISSKLLTLAVAVRR